jgi:alkanesulfonate monooxygenase SsuD/methylene tetrahydromethanopterin reductase-like flavin-dependent oxidoreductase (luciferase family)
MQFGVHIFGVGALADPQTLAEVAQLAEARGYHSIFVADHLMVPRGLQSQYPCSARH